MIHLNSKKQPSALDQAIAKVFSEMQPMKVDSDEYAKMATQLEKLYALKDLESKRKISPETAATILTNLAGILVIVHHEKANVITSKALGFVMKLK